MGFRKITIGLTLCLLAGYACAQTVLDGPYVRHGDRGWEAWTVEAVDGGARTRTRSIQGNDTVSVAAVGDLPAFDVRLRAAAKVAADEPVLPARAKLFVVADTHGEFEILARMLMRHQIIDARSRWSFGRGQLVVLGDVFDRGPHHLEILWLLYELEAQARKAGGGVHLILGNHETMVLRGDLRYLHPKYVATAAAFGVRYDALFDERSVLGQWLRTRPAVLKLGRRLYLHAGISRALVDRGDSLADINASVRAALARSPPEQTADRERAAFMLGPLGPLWYRGYFPEHVDFPAAGDADVEAALKRFGVDTILVGHTIVPTVTALFGGKVIAVQVYPKREDATHTRFEALLIDGARIQRAEFDGTLGDLTTSADGARGQP